MRALLLVVLVALAGTARADGFYFTEGFGGSDVKDELGQYMSSAVRFQIAIGMRSGPWALETHLGAHINVDAPVESPGWLDSITTYGLDLKYIQPLVDHNLEVYLRGGLAYAQIDNGYGSTLADYGGRGVDAGAGIQLKGKVRALGFLAWPFFFLNIGPKVTGAVWLDAGYSFFRLHRDGRIDTTPAIDAQITTISGGFAVGSDF